MINDVRSISRAHTDEGREEEKGEDRCLCSALVLREELEQVFVSQACALSCAVSLSHRSKAAPGRTEIVVPIKENNTRARIK